MMVWNKPRNVWQWLLLLIPAVAAIAAAQMAKWWMPLPPLHLANGAIVANVGGLIARTTTIAFEVIAAGSIIIALVLSHGPSLGRRIMNAVFFMLCLFFLNSFVAFCGCALIGVPNPGRYEIAPAPIDSGSEKSPTP
jgi:hypothetical protein